MATDTGADYAGKSLSEVISSFSTLLGMVDIPLPLRVTGLFMQFINELHGLEKHRQVVVTSTVRTPLLPEPIPAALPQLPAADLQVVVPAPPLCQACGNDPEIFASGYCEVCHRGSPTHVKWLEQQAKVPVADADAQREDSESHRLQRWLVRLKGHVHDPAVAALIDAALTGRLSDAAVVPAERAFVRAEIAPYNDQRAEIGRDVDLMLVYQNVDGKRVAFTQLGTVEQVKVVNSLVKLGASVLDRVVVPHQYNVLMGTAIDNLRQCANKLGGTVDRLGVVQVVGNTFVASATAPPAIDTRPTVEAMEESKPVRKAWSPERRAAHEERMKDPAYQAQVKARMEKMWQARKASKKKLPA